MLREKLIEYFSFTRKERVGFLVLIFLIIMIFIVPYFFDFRRDQKEDQFKNEIAQLKSIEKSDSIHRTIVVNDKDEESHGDRDSPAFQNNDLKKISLFYFDPNIISGAQWKQLGLRDKTILTIQHYLSKGGRFKAAADLKKVYGIHDDDYERLFPFIKINNTQVSDHSKAVSSFKNNVRDSIATKKTFSIVDINSADSSALAELPGIGIKLAARIVHFRERLGGFYSVEQIKEVYGLSESTYQLINPLMIVKGDSLQKIDLNTADINILKQHPYIRWELGKAIIQYRNQHGPFKNPEELLKITLVTQEMYMKISAYIKKATITY